MTTPSESDGELDAALLRARVTVLGLGAAVCGYALIGAIITSPQSYEPPVGDDQAFRWLLRAILAVVALINFFTAAYVRRAVVDRGGDGGQRAPLGDRLFLATLVAGAFAEAVGVYGLVLTLIGGELLDVLCFGAVALVALGLLFPTRTAWAERARLEALTGLDAGPAEHSLV